METHMELDIKQASDSLSTIKNAETVAEQYSQNNGTVHFVWVSVFMISMILCDVVRQLIGRTMPPQVAIWAPTIVGTMLCTLLGCLELFWRRRYLRHLPVQSSRIPSKWTYFRLTDGILSGWNNLYAVIVWIGLIWFIFSHNVVAEHLRLDARLYIATIFGVVVTFPTFVIGCRLWLSAHGKGQA